MMHGTQKEQVDLSFSIPSECARDIENGSAQVGLVPVAEIARQGLEIIPAVGIACRGPVRSILLFSRVPWREIRTLAADASSRTSVELARVILRERFGICPSIHREEPELGRMLGHSDAALIIGDPALRLEPQTLSYEWLDLGEEWFKLTQLPFVFAAWAGKRGLNIGRLTEITTASYLFGNSQLEQIIESEFRKRGVTRETARFYLTQAIKFAIGHEEQRGLEAFFELAALGAPALAGRQV